LLWRKVQPDSAHSFAERGLKLLSPSNIQCEAAAFRYFPNLLIISKGQRAQHGRSSCHVRETGGLRQFGNVTPASPPTREQFVPFPNHSRKHLKRRREGHHRRLQTHKMSIYTLVFGESTESHERDTESQALQLPRARHAHDWLHPEFDLEMQLAHHLFSVCVLGEERGGQHRRPEGMNKSKASTR